MSDDSPGYNFPGFTPGAPFLEPRPGSKFGYHGGQDLIAKPDTDVPAKFDGKVFRSGPIYGYGRTVIVESIAPNGTRFYTLYGHLGPGDLPAPDTPVQGGMTILGQVGSKDFVNSFPGAHISGPHLHWEIINGRVKLNPTGNLGIISSDRTFRTDPAMFDINHPVFPYLNGQPPMTPAPAPVPPPLDIRPPAAQGPVTTTPRGSPSAAPDILPPLHFAPDQSDAPADPIGQYLRPDAVPSSASDNAVPNQDTPADQSQGDDRSDGSALADRWYAEAIAKIQNWPSSSPDDVHPFVHVQQAAARFLAVYGDG